MKRQSCQLCRKWRVCMTHKTLSNDDGFWIYHAQPSMKAISEWKTCHQITSKLQIGCSPFLMFYGWRGLRKNDVEWTKKVEVIQAESLAVGKAFKTMSWLASGFETENHWHFLILTWGDLDHIHLPVCLWIMDPHSRAPKKNTSHGKEVLPQGTMHLIQKPCYQHGSQCQDPADNQTTWRPPDHRKETQTAVVWSCLPFIRSGQNQLARHGERGKKTR